MILSDDDSSIRPQVPRQHEIDELATSAVSDKFTKAGCRFEPARTQAGREYGIDGRLTFTINGAARGFVTTLQIKGTESRDTDTYQAFRFPCEVKTLLTLVDDGGAPAYWVVHNVTTGSTYVREVHEIVALLDRDHPGWKTATEKVNVVFLQSMLLTPEKINKIRDEAAAWGLERYSTTKDVVEYLEKEAEKFALVMRHELKDQKKGEYRWMGMKSGYIARTPYESLGYQRMMGNLLSGYGLCCMFRTRAGAEPHRLTGNGADILDLAELTRRLNRAKTKHLKLISEVAKKQLMSPPAAGDDWPSMPKQSGLFAPVVSDATAEDACSQMTEHLRRMGFDVVIGDDPLELSVRCGSAVGLLSFALFNKDDPRREDVLALKDRAAATGSCANTMFFTLKQLDTLPLHRWLRPEGTPNPKVVLATVEGGLEEFFATILEEAVKLRSWPDRAVGGAEFSETEYSVRMPDFMTPDKEDALIHQQKIVRTHAREALTALERGEPMTFYFHWDMKRLETHTIASHAELAIYLLRGAEVFHDLGGPLSKAGSVR